MKNTETNSLNYHKFENQTNTHSLMKFVHFIIALFTVGILFSACQKEYSAENGNSVGTLQSNATGDCMPILVNGTYIKDTALKTSNYIEVKVNFSQSGAYLIKTDTINGYSFTGSGAVSVAGVSTVRLQGFGKPIGPSAADIFQVKYQNSACEFSVPVTGSGGGGGGGSTAIYTLGGSPGSCTGAGLSGTYTQGIPTNASNTATVNVNVTQPGTYTITSGALVNNVTFSGSGTFATAGANTIVLTATGNPAFAGPFTYPVSAGSSNCTFTVTYNGGTPPPAGTDSLSAVVNGVYKTFMDGAVAFLNNTTIPGYTTLLVAGDSNFVSPEGVGFSVSINSGAFTPGSTYTVNQGPAILIGARYADAGGIEYVATSTPPITQTPPFTVTITGISATRVRGTFSGPLKNNNGAGPGVKTIQNGYFDLPL